MIKRLRADYSDKEIVELNKAFYNHKVFKDHILRVNITADLLAWSIDHYSSKSIADLACGDGSIVFKALDRVDNKPKEVILGDMSEQSIDYVKGLATDPQINFKFISGRIENNLKNMDRVNLTVATEILEHVNDPEGLIKDLGLKTNFLILSTPDSQFDQNYKHLWVWTREDILDMLSRHNFSPTIELGIDTRYETYPYRFQVWLARNKA